MNCADVFGCFKQKMTALLKKLSRKRQKAAFPSDLLPILYPILMTFSVPSVCRRSLGKIAGLSSLALANCAKLQVCHPQITAL
ncbi:MAG: hypothetical protein AAGU12_01835 [Clostridiales bacterium]